MRNFIVTVILIIITLFVINLFPMGKNFLGSIVNTFHQKQTNVMNEYERVKDSVDEVTTTVTETKKKVDNAVENVNKAVDTASEAMDSVNKLVGKDEEDTTKTDVAPVTTTAPQK